MPSATGMKDRPPQHSIVGINGDAAAIVKGEVLCYKDLSASPYTVQKASSGGATVAYSLFAGIAISNANVGDPVEFVASGYVACAKRFVRSRAASTNTWASVDSSASIAQGVYCTIDTANNAVASSGAGAAGAAASMIVMAVSNASIASIASAASTYGGTALLESGTYKVYLRALG